MPDSEDRGWVEVEMEIRTEGGQSDVWPASTGPIIHKSQKVRYRLSGGLEEGRGETVYRPTHYQRRALLAHQEPPTGTVGHYRNHIWGNADHDWQGAEINPPCTVDVDDHPFGIFNVNEVQTVPVSYLIVVTGPFVDMDLEAPGLPQPNDFGRGRNAFLEGELERETEDQFTLGASGP